VETSEVIKRLTLAEERAGVRRHQSGTLHHFVVMIEYRGIPGKTYDNIHSFASASMLGFNWRASIDLMISRDFAVVSVDMDKGTSFAENPTKRSQLPYAVAVTW
jgi:hypothetical protein